MKVSELIKQLKDVDPEADVMVSADGDLMELHDLSVADETIEDDCGPLVNVGDVVLNASL